MITVEEFVKSVIEILGVVHMELIIAIAIAQMTVSFILKLFNSYKAEEKKKDYEDEMSIYDEIEVESPALTPYQTGISLNELIDGEIPDKAYRKD